MPTFDQPIEAFACPHLGAFTVHGADAQNFLQSQLTQDMQTVTNKHAALAGFCTAQGRLWASMLLIGTPEGKIVGLACSDLMESFLKRLRMFVLRSKVTIEVDNSIQTYGITVAEADLSALSEVTNQTLSAQAWQACATRLGHWITLPSATSGVARFQLIATEAQLNALAQAVGESWKFTEQSQYWQRQDIEAGIGWIQAATQDLFIAQTLNLDLLHGVSFTKGCYPGQEVVARAHYRGTVKRRMHIATTNGAHVDLAPAMDIFTDGEPDNPIGRLISVATDADQTWVLFEAPFKALEDKPLRAGTANGPSLFLQPMPYSLEKPEI